MSGNQVLGKQILKGSFWIVILEVCNQLLQFLKTFYAATLLTPADFGIIGFAFLIVAFLDIFSTTGMKEAIIQRKDDLTDYLDTVWTVEFSKGLVVVVLAFLLTPLVIDIIKPANPELTADMVRFIGIIYFLQCSTSIGVVYFEKNIQFMKFFFYQFSGTLVDVAVSLYLVNTTHSVMALFYGSIAGYATRVIFSFLLTSYRPGFKFQLAKARELLKYGRWIFGGKIFNFIGLQADSIITTSFFSLSSLGIYQMAARIGNLPMSQVSNIIGRLAFPSFSKLQSDIPSLKRFFLTTLNVLSLALMPVIILVFCLIPEFTRLFLGDRWLGIVPIVQILILSGFLRIFVSLVDNLFAAVGEPRFGSYLQTSRFVVFMVVAAPLGYFLGLTGIALSGLVSLVAVLIIFLRKAARRLSITLSDLARDLFYPLIYGVGVGALLYFGKGMIKTEIGIVLFFVLAAATGVAYLGIGLLITRTTRIRLFDRAINIVQGYLIRQ
jgi:O-antigen/teichoic acid export membrane protein